MFERAFFGDYFREVFRGWYRSLKRTSESCAVWERQGGVLTPNFLSASGRQCDGVTRMLPAMAAWVAGEDNPGEINVDGQTVRVLEVLRDALVHGTDPKHADFWQYSPADRQNQRQVESSIVAWSLWLARKQLLPTLSRDQVANVQAWLASCTQYTDLYSNWSLFVATNHAARIALKEHGFEGDQEVIRRSLIVGDEAYAGDGWLWDAKWSGIDYYNFWVNGSHHYYLAAMLPAMRDERLMRALERARRRMADLPYMMDAAGRNVLFGRSLAYRWGWLNGLAASVFHGDRPVQWGLAREMLGRNLQWWREAGSFDASGALIERLTAAGSDGARDRYINCGHPYWGMQAFLCLALPSSHGFWTEVPARLPIERGDFLEKRQGPGLVFQGVTGKEVRLFNLRNLDHGGKALYEKFVYSTEFPCNLQPAGGTCFDNQFGLRLADGKIISPDAVKLVDVDDPRGMHVAWSFAAGEFRAMVNTFITIDGAAYETRHEIQSHGPVPTGAMWVEGGFALGHRRDETVAGECDGQRGLACCGDRRIETSIIQGWQRLYDLPETRLLTDSERANIVHEAVAHFVVTASVQAKPVVLVARHSAISSERDLPL